MTSQKPIKKIYKKLLEALPALPQKAPAFEARDVNYIEKTIEKIALNQSEEAFYHNIRAVSVSNLDTQDNRENAVEILSQNGILIVPGFFNESRAEAVQNNIEHQLRDELSDTQRTNDTEYETLVVHRSGQRFQSYSDYQHYPKAVADIRRGRDEGMVDIFNVDLALPDALRELRAAFEDEAVMSIIEKSGYGALEPANLNAYINRGITQTRGFHIDSQKNNLKGFIYLTDVTRMDDGPYCYVRGTHNPESPMRSVNPALSTQAGRKHTDSPFIDPRMVTPALAKKGDLVLSDQSGIHRGIAQREDAERYMAVMRYK